MKREEELKKRLYASIMEVHMKSNYGERIEIQVKHKVDKYKRHQNNDASKSMQYMCTPGPEQNSIKQRLNPKIPQNEKKL